MGHAGVRCTCIMHLSLCHMDVRVLAFLILVENKFSVYDLAYVDCSKYQTLLPRLLSLRNFPDSKYKDMKPKLYVRLASKMFPNDIIMVLLGQYIAAHLRPFSLVARQQPRSSALSSCLPWLVRTAQMDF